MNQIQTKTRKKDLKIVQVMINAKKGENQDTKKKFKNLKMFQK